MHTDANHFFRSREGQTVSSVFIVNFQKINPWTPERHTRESGYPEAFNFPGFRVALAIASLPGMTPKREKTFLRNRLHRIGNPRLIDAIEILGLLGGIENNLFVFAMAELVPNRQEHVDVL